MRNDPPPPAPLLVQVLPVERGGVLDYAQCLEHTWAQQGRRSHLIPLSQELAGEQPLTERVRQHLAHPSQACAIVLHYSGYGYHPRGIGFWLIAQLRALRRERRDALTLVVMFHELVAWGRPPWRSAFWLAPFQAMVARRLARMADAIVTNTEQHARWLRRTAGPARPLLVRPVFSNVGEPANAPPLDARRPVAVVFGSASTRQRAFHELRGREDTLRGLGVTELIEAGSGPASQATPSGLPCRHVGRLDLDQLRDLLHGARFALLDYPPEFLAKSGVFAAYAAHGCLVLNTSAAGPDTDGLAHGRHYLNLQALGHTSPAPGAAEAIAQRLMAWYASHRLGDQARDLLRLTAAPGPSVQAR